MAGEDTTLTVEEAAKILKVNPATVLRELRGNRLPGNTVGRAWRIRPEDLREYLKGTRPVRVTEGELAFETYLSSLGLMFAFEEPVPGTTKRPDYRVDLDGQPSRFEVKQFDPQLEDFHEGAGTFDPYPPLRAKIQAARQKFHGLKGTASCSLVLYNNGKPLIFLDPMHVYGAMLGNVGITFPLNTKTGVGDMSRMRNAFLGGGKMLRYAKGGKEPVAPQNTTISAIVAVSTLDVGYRRFAIAVAQRERQLGRDLSLEERLAMIEESNETETGLGEAALRVRVYDNPYAVTPLNLAFGRGPWDERFGPNAGHLDRVFVGVDLAELEEQEVATGIKVNTWRIRD